jgi:hypothetical protein
LARVLPLTSVSSRIAASLLVVGAAALGCSPEVLIARNEPVATAGSGMGGSAGGSLPTSGSPASGGTDAEGGVGAGAGAGAEAGSPEDPDRPPRLLADSIADFSLEQGLHGWYYGFDDGDIANFAPMTRQSIITAYEPPTGDVWRCWANDTGHWTQLFSLGGHPNGTDTSPPSMPLVQRAVRRWISNYEGHVTISGELAKIDVTLDGSNGIEGKILIDGVEIYSRIIEGDDGGGVAYGVEADLRVGSTVDFAIDPRDGDDHHDLTRFTAVIAQTTPPS